MGFHFFPVVGNKNIFALFGFLRCFENGVFLGDGEAVFGQHAVGNAFVNNDLFQIDFDGGAEIEAEVAEDGLGGFFGFFVDADLDLGHFIHGGWGKVAG